MAIVAFIGSSFIGLLVSILSMLTLGIGLVPAFALYMGIGILLPVVSIMTGHAERRIAAATRAQPYLR